MADPVEYEPQFDFSNYQSTNPSRPLPGHELDVELWNISNAMGGTQTALADIRRSDGKLRNGIVTVDALEPGLRPDGTVALAAAAAAEASATQAALYDGPWLDTVLALRDDTSLTYAAGSASSVAVGSYVQTRADGFSYQVAASGATDHHIATAGGVKLYVLPGARGFDARAFGTGRTHVEAQAACAACTAAGGGTVYLAPGQWTFDAPLLLPVAPMELVGVRGATRISGAAASLVVYPLSVRNGAGEVVTQHVRDLFFVLLDDQVGIDLRQTWDAAGKNGPTITGNEFFHSSATTTTTKSIRLRGVWTAEISGNRALGRGGGGAPTTGIGGYFVYVDLGADVNTSVMNLDISNNFVTTISKPVWLGDRVGAGRIEGIRIVNNSFVAGEAAVTAYKVLATTINSNIISDFASPIVLDGCFDWQIVGNSEVDGTVACITLRGAATSFCENGVITGNCLKPKGSAVGVLFENDMANSRVRNVVISGNKIGRNFITPQTGTGIRFDNSFVVSRVSITGNAFATLLVGIDYQSSVDNVTIELNGNVYDAVVTPIVNPARSGTLIEKSFALTAVRTLTGGATSEDVDFTIPANVFSAKPIAGTCHTDASHTTDPMIGFYANDGSGSTAVNARFRVYRLNGASLIGAARRFNIELRGLGFATS